MTRPPSSVQHPSPRARLDRRDVLKFSAAGLATAGLVAIHPNSAKAHSMRNDATNTQMTKDWDKTFPRSEKVHHEKVTFTNRYGIVLAGDLYRPKDRAGERLPALAISGPFGAVKEQSSGLYAQTMAERGFVALAFDPSYTGESSGEPRNVASPDINTEDFSAAVDFLGLQSAVDRDRIGLIGICGFGGMGLNAAAVDKRVKAVVTTSMYDMSRVMARGYYDKLGREERAQMLERMSQQRWADAVKGSPAPGARILPETLEGVTDPVARMYFDYYRTPRGFHARSPNSNGGWTATNALSFMNMPLLTYIKEIAPRPVLLIAGEKAHSRYFSEDAYTDAAGPKELLIIPNADHVDLYDRADKIPFEKIFDFFARNL
ncbi:alpha/beta hydrolase [Phenylobacterium sp. LjRoot219]|uniref:alpha/beta hydrolase n=1 Tax=Phenylobacterium sp. LjRoot219 TaxID=3342283 RepID=UPI003ECF1B4A